MAHNLLIRRDFLKSACILSLSPWLNSCRDSNTIINPQTSIVCWGDSLTAGSGGISYTNFLAKAFRKYTIANFSIGGQNSRQIAARQGGLPTTLSIIGNSFAGTMAIKVNNISTQLLSTKSNNNIYSLYGKINNIPCVLTRNAKGSISNEIELYTLTPINSSTESIPPNSLFVSDNAEFYRSSFHILWMGRNDGDFANTAKYINNCVNNIGKTDNFLVLGILCSLFETSGTIAFDAIKKLNLFLEEKYGNRFIQMTPPTYEEMKEVSYLPFSQDIRDINNGVFPSGLRKDNIHLKNKGYQIVAGRIIKRLRDLQIA